MSKIKSFMNDSLWSIAGLLLMNVTAQFAVYPVLNRFLGSEAYGNVLYMISIINIVAVSAGCALNYSRMIIGAGRKTSNGDYNTMLLAICALCIPVCFLFVRCMQKYDSVWEWMLYWLLMCVTVWRYYADVEFRLSLNYKGYFRYYAFISVGYLFGIVLFIKTGIWYFALLPGEAAGVLFVIIKGNVIRQEWQKRSVYFNECLKSFGYLIAANFISNLMFNSDRLVLKMFAGGEAVTVYYLASLVGKTVSLITMPLNSVVIGYLARHNKIVSKGFMKKSICILTAVSFVISIICVMGSCIIIRFLYPNEYTKAEPYFFTANLAQVFYFMSSILTTVLLCFTLEKFQLYINVLYAVLFAAIVLPFTYFNGIGGFAIGILGVNGLRFLSVSVFCIWCPQNKGRENSI